MNNEQTTERQAIEDALADIMRDLGMDASASWQRFMRMTLTELIAEHEHLRSIDVARRRRSTVQALVKKLWQSTTLSDRMTAPPCRRRFRFSLRTMFVAVTLFAAAFAVAIAYPEVAAEIVVGAVIAVVGIAALTAELMPELFRRR